MNLKRLFKPKKLEVGEFIPKEPESEESSIEEQPKQVHEDSPSEQLDETSQTTSSPESIVTDSFDFEKVVISDSISSIADNDSDKKKPLIIDTGLAIKWKPENGVDYEEDSLFTPSTFASAKVAIAMKKIPSPAQDRFPGAPNRNSHRFLNINPNYKIKRLPYDTLKMLNDTFSEYVGGEEALRYKSLDPRSDAGYLMEPRRDME